MVSTQQPEIILLRRPSFSQRLQALKQQNIIHSLKQIRHGIEREALRINRDGSLAQTPHGKALGSALKHELITTDFSEALLEFITPAESDIQVTLGQLWDIHKYVQENIGDELLWPMSMPCFIKSEDSIPIAQYGSSNVGKMKTLYRVGLKNRYGSMMQAIAGVHFNFSLPDEFWQQWLPEADGVESSQDAISDAYFALIRNFRRFCWLIPYLYGSSPAICSSFLQKDGSTLAFETLGKGTLYLPYATSLRMSDLGYTNSAQSSLQICYNQVDNYVRSLKAAIYTPSEEFQKFSGQSGGEYQQLNSNVLQIENELYSPIRPKQPTLPLEKPTDALADRGVSYIEVRALDVNPFSAVGIEAQQFHFLDVFLVYCLVSPSGDMPADYYQQTEENLTAVVLEGRKPGLQLEREEQTLSLTSWATELFEELKQVASVLDEANDTQDYSQAVARELAKIQDPDKTPSARILAQLQQQQLDNGQMALQQAANYQQQLFEHNYSHFSQEQLAKMASTSLEQQHKAEQQEEEPFESFLQNYFADKSKSCA